MSERAKTGEVVWYATGRFYSRPNDDLLDVGYFLNLQGITAPLFDGKLLSEATAYFTFAADPFTAPSIDNGGLTIGIDATGSFGVYLRETPGATFDDPDSFAKGTCIATFSRVAIVPTTKVAVGSASTLLSNVFTAKLQSSQPFTFGGETYDFRELVGFGITQWGTAATEPMGSNGVPFLGSAIRVG